MRNWPRSHRMSRQDEKRIEVSLEAQRMTAYEAGNPVFETQISTGDNVTNPKYQTPTGELPDRAETPLPAHDALGPHLRQLRPAGRALGMLLRTAYAHAFHGAYWHNGFGRIRSHGCVNLAPEDAKWLYLWSTPVMQPYNQLQYDESGGTRVVVA